MLHQARTKEVSRAATKHETAISLIETANGTQSSNNEPCLFVSSSLFLYLVPPPKRTIMKSCYEDSPNSPGLLSVSRPSKGVATSGNHPIQKTPKSTFMCYPHSTTRQNWSLRRSEHLKSSNRRRIKGRRHRHYKILLGRVGVERQRRHQSPPRVLPAETTRPTPMASVQLYALRPKLNPHPRHL